MQKWMNNNNNKVFKTNILFIILKTDNFQLWFLYKRDLRISTARKHLGNVRNKHF